MHPYAEFRLKTYAPTAFRFFRNAFGVDPSSFMVSTLKIRPKNKTKQNFSYLYMYIYSKKLTVDSIILHVVRQNKCL